MLVTILSSRRLSNGRWGGRSPHRHQSGWRKRCGVSLCQGCRWGIIGTGRYLRIQQLGGKTSMQSIARRSRKHTIEMEDSYGSRRCGHVAIRIGKPGESGHGMATDLLQVK